MCAVFCENCHRILSAEAFEKREDRFHGLYAFCKNCMKEQGRAVDHPPAEERGGGNINPKIRS